MKQGSRIIVALDYATSDEALAFAARVTPAQCKLKIGKELFTQAGPDIVRRLVDRGFDIFLDLKFHDIPNTVAKACSAAAGLGIWMLNVHTLGGRAMLLAAREAVDKSSRRPLLIGVTILTSMSDADLTEIGILTGVEQNVLRLAKLAQETKLDGVVCSALEAKNIRVATSPSFKLVTPGIRLADSSSNDQKRIATPAAALSDGADYLVIGRPITQANDPMAVIMRIEKEITHS